MISNRSSPFAYELYACESASVFLTRPPPIFHCIVLNSILNLAGRFRRAEAAEKFPVETFTDDLEFLRLEGVGQSNVGNQSDQSGKESLEKDAPKRFKRENGECEGLGKLHGKSHADSRHRHAKEAG